MSPPSLRLLFGILFVLPLAIAGCAPKAAEKKAPPLQKVNVVTPVRENITEYEDFTGRTAALEMIELRSRVNGYLHDIGFEDGKDVQKDQLLFEIDRAPFQAEVDRASAAVDQFQARVDRMTRQYERLLELVNKNAASQNEFDLAKFDRAEAVASLKAAEAALDTANLNLNYAEIRAPISGRIGRRLVDKGNLVQADTTALATIVPIDRVYIYFDMDERTVIRLRELVREGKLDKGYMTDTTVDFALAGSNDKFERSAKVDFEDNQIDAATGTLRLRAIADNKDRFLSPGMFVRVRYPIGDAAPELLVPEEAVGSDQGRPFVYVVGAEDKVAYRPVEVGPQVGARRVIRKGVEAGDRVVVTGLQRIKRDQPVDPQETTTEPPTVAQANPTEAAKPAPIPASSR